MTGRQDLRLRQRLATAFALTGLLAVFSIGACSTAIAPAPGAATGQRYSSRAPSQAESYCAWYAEAHAEVLYFGEAPFWSAMRANGDDPLADLHHEGPQPIGRFDLRSARPLAALEVGEAGARSGVWDVLPHPNGLVYFTTFYETAGSVDPATGDVRRFEALGRGLNELALAGDGNIAVSRYGGHGGDDLASGSLVVFSQQGERILEAPLSAPPGLALAPKTVAWDPRARRYWIVTDLVWRDPSQPPPPSMHPALVLDESGHEIARVNDVELHFVRFASSDDGGRGVAAIEAGGELRLVELDEREPADQLRAGSGRLLDSHFPAALDFVQDIAFGPEGQSIVTRWSGAVHIVPRSPDAASSRVQLPREEGLYYAAAIAPDGRVCATHCHDRATAAELAGIDVVCAPVASGEAAP